MEKNMVLRLEKEKIYRLALFIGELMLKNGGETYRVERLCTDLCESKGFKHISLFVTPTFIIIGDDRADGITFMKVIKERTINLYKVSETNQLALNLIEGKDIDISNSIAALKEIDSCEPYSSKIKLIAAAVASSAFSALFNVGWREIVFTFFIAVIALLISKGISEMTKTSMLGVIVATFCIGILALSLEYYKIVDSSNLIIIGSILPFLPGVAITKSISDLVSGDLLSGNSRATEAFLTALSIGVGIAGAIKIWIKFGGTV
ncbi:MAG: threonine/serine ThrE exporter family protein [Fusobacteriaceae bacterium]